MIAVPTLNACRELFAYIRTRMASNESAPVYEEEERGLLRLQATFDFVERPEYADILAKSAYLFCSIIDGHHFSNGNKRLAITLLTYFLLTNGYRIHVPTMEMVEQELHRYFPHLTWEDVKSFRYPHEYFLYHLALVIADRKQKGHMTFPEEQKAVRELLGAITLPPT